MADAPVVQRGGDSGLFPEGITATWYQYRVPYPLRTPAQGHEGSAASYITQTRTSEVVDDHWRLRRALSPAECGWCEADLGETV